MFNLHVHCLSSDNTPLKTFNYEDKASDLHYLNTSLSNIVRQ